jgi:flagellin
MTVINTNVKSLAAQNAITLNNRSMSTAMEQLSSGKRINSAKDDAAGLAISEKMNSQVRGLNQAIRNANDGISLLQTAEGAMVEITNMMQRMRELAVQSANDTNAQDDREYLDLEFQQLKQEINRVTKNTQWNGMNILDQTEPASGAREGTFTFQVGANNGDSHKITHTLDSLAFGASSGTAAFAGVESTSSGVATLTITDGGFDAGDVITLAVNNQQFQYTVKSDDLTGATAALRQTAIIDALAAEIGSTFADLNVTKTATTVVFTNPAGEKFSSYAKDTNGKLATVDALEVTSQSLSDSAIRGLDVALKTVSEARAEIGAVINRLNYAVDNMTNVSMNTSESRSRILDTDYAKASAELARTQIISQAATAMLAQANQQPQAVLQLLQG